MLATMLVIAIVLFVVVLLGLAMVRGGGYDVISFIFLGLLCGFALAIFLGAAIVS
ncbi:MAG: hypothetical protein IPF56_00050 [Chloroflexi bacterium]|nr:hypothetical protein [Chloroflexota bacterium]MBK6710548.1 hypothetical protein [Chloroflexota bacterium]MBK7179838.1 hypothetical protein [Chloroflexota bacterium]MBK8933320.1 hypothetical protein [Chloroflexota bacterium]